MGIYRYIIFRIILYACLFLFQQSLFAGLNVNPVVVEVAVSEIDKTTKTIRVENTGENPINVRVEVNKVNKNDRDVNNWFVIEPKQIEIKPKQCNDFLCSITPPFGAEGELRCMIFFVADEIGEKKSMFGIRFGVPVYAIVEETANLDAEVDKISINYDMENKILKGIVYVKNKGNVHIRPYVNIDIMDKESNKINSFEIPFGQPAQVGQTRPFMFSQKIELLPGNYKLIVNVDYGKMYGLKDYIATKEVEFEVKSPEVVKDVTE